MMLLGNGRGGSRVGTVSSHRCTMHLTHSWSICKSRQSSRRCRDRIGWYPGHILRTPAMDIVTDLLLANNLRVMDTEQIPQGNTKCSLTLVFLHRAATIIDLDLQASTTLHHLPHPPEATVYPRTPLLRRRRATPLVGVLAAQ